MASFNRKIICILAILIICFLYSMAIITTKHLQLLNDNIVSIHTKISKMIYPINADGTIRILLYNGCSGSTATINIIQTILNKHNFNVYLLGDFEITKPNKNPYYKEIKKGLIKKKEGTGKGKKYIIRESLFKLNEEIFNRNKILLIKAKYDEIKYLSRSKKLDTKFTGIQRRNKLDRAICVVKDCFRNGTLGYPALAHDNTIKKTNRCFDRRKSPNKDELKVYFNIHNLISYLRKTVKDEENDIEYTKEHVAPSAVQYYEDLYEFGYTNNETAFQNSIDTWEMLLKSFIPFVDKDIISDVLLQMKNTRKLPLAHKDTIVNYDEVSKALHKSGSVFGNFLRE